MSLSTTAFTDRIFPPGSLEWHQQERFRRIQRIQHEREKHRLQSLFLRELRQQQGELSKNAPRLLNNNTKLSASASVVLKKTTSAKLPKTKSSSPVNSVKKSKSTAAKLQPAKETSSTSSLVLVESQAKTYSKAKKAKKAKSKVSTPKVSRKSSTALPSTSRKPSSTTRKVSKTKAAGTTKAKESSSRVEAKIKPSGTKANTSIAKFTGRNASVKGSSKTVAAKVSFSGTKNNEKDSFYCPVTTPVSILKNRQKIDELCKSTLKPSAESKENFIKVNSSKTEPLVIARDPELGISFTPFPPPNPPPHPNIGVCKAFPGTKEWDEYWTRFSKAMNKYNKEMTEYEQQAAEAFKDDLARYSEQTQKLTREREIYKNLGSKGIELGLIPPPPITSKELKGLQLFNGYIMKSKGIKGTASNLPGSPTGVRFEVDIRGAEPENVLIQKDHNLLTISMDKEKFLRIGTPSGKLAGDIQVWPPIDGRIIVDAP